MLQILILFLKLRLMQILDCFPPYNYPDIDMILPIMAIFCFFRCSLFLDLQLQCSCSTQLCQQYWRYCRIPELNWWVWLLVYISRVFLLNLHLHSLVCCRYVARPCWTSRSWLQTCGLSWSASSLTMRRSVHCITRCVQTSWQRNSLKL